MNSNTHTNFIENFKGILVIRTVYSIKSMDKKNLPVYFHREVMRKFYDPEKKKFSQVSESLGGFTGSNWHGEMSLRDLNYPNTQKYELGRGAIYYPYVGIPKYFKRAGFRVINELDMSHFAYDLMRIPKIETLLKIKIDDVVLAMFYNRGIIESYWKALKISLRHNYIQSLCSSEIGTYIDYLKMLASQGKDLSNPHYVCPEDLSLSHNLFVRKAQVKAEKLNREANKAYQIEQLKRHDERASFLKKKMKNYKNLHISKGDYNVVPMMTLDQVRNEGALLSHCIYASCYDEEEDTILLSCRYKGVVTETAEFNLKSNEVDQCRGYENEITEHNKAFIDLINQNNNLIKNCLKSKKKKPIKELIIWQKKQKVL